MTAETNVPAQASDEPMRAAFAVLETRDAPFKATLGEIGQRIGYGRAIQLLGQMWDDMLQADYPGVGRHQESVHRRSDIERIEAGEPLGRKVVYYQKRGAKGQVTALVPMDYEIKNVARVVSETALYGKVPTPRATVDVERDAERFDFMMRVADNPEGVEALAVNYIGNESMETDRPESIQMRELIDAAIAATKGAKP